MSNWLFTRKGIDDNILILTINKDCQEIER